MPKSDLPFADQFSPKIVDLVDVLLLAKAHEGDRDAMEAAFLKKYYADRDTSDNNKKKLAMNLRLGLQNYQILDADMKLTTLGEELLSLQCDPETMYRRLSRHILLNLNGLALVQCVQDMRYAGDRITLQSISDTMGERGFYVPRTGTHASKMRLWLERSGVFRKNQQWLADERRIEELLGTGNEDLDRLAELTPQQSGFLKALANIGDAGRYLSNEIQKLAVATYGTKFDDKQFAKSVLHPLEKAGYITLERGTKQSGRGAKPFKVGPTDKLRADIIIPIIEQYESMVHADLRPLLRKPLSEIIAELDDESSHVKGLALEALAFKLMRLIDLDYVATRLRGSETGGAEVDLVFESKRLVFTRWQVQCKNTFQVRLDDLAKEVGLTHMLKSNAIVMVGTGSIGREARRYAQTVMKDSNLAIILIDGKDIEVITQDPPTIIDVLNREAEHAMRLKKLEEV